MSHLIYGGKNENSLNLLSPTFRSIHIDGISTILKPIRCALAVISKLNVNPFSDSYFSILSNTLLEKSLNELVESLIEKL